MDQINSITDISDMEMRKKARQDRLKQRLDAAKKFKSVLDSSENDCSSLEMTIDQSNESLFKTFMEGKDLVTNIRISSDTKELIRMDTETTAKEVRLKDLEDESNLALDKMTSITRKWEVLGEFNDPLDLNQELKEQRVRCENLINQKDILIGSLKNELKLADERFVGDRLDMLEDISILARRIDEQVSIMKKSYLDEIDHIEEAVDLSRKKLLEDKNKEWDALYDKKEAIEVSNLAARFTMMETNEEEIQNVHVTHSEKYRETKIRLDTNIQFLEQELEQIKALCLVNSEKLDYNYQVLKKREDENIIVKNNQKRNLNKLQEEVFKLKKEIEEKNDLTNQEILKLDKELCRLQKNIVDIEKKADHFCEVNDKKFQQIWNMKTSEATNLLGKILAADKEIHEEILGLKWDEPNIKPLRKEDLVSFQASSAMILEIFQQPCDFLSVEPTLGDVNDENSCNQKTLVKRILNLISDNCEFLIKEELDDILKPYSTDERTLVRLDNVFNAIGVTKKEEIAIMENFFLPYAKCLICSVTGKFHVGDVEQGSSSELRPMKVECNKEQHSFVIEKPNVLKALREYVSKLNSSKMSKRNTTDVYLAKDRCTMARWLSREDLERYWNRFREIFQLDRDQLWDALYNGLTKYYCILQERSKLQNKAQTLMQQNMELRGLVEKYFPGK